MKGRLTKGKINKELILTFQRAPDCRPNNQQKVQACNMIGGSGLLSTPKKLP